MRIPVHFSRALLPALVGLCLLSQAFADGPKDNDPKKVRPVPPVGIEIEAKLLDEFQTRVKGIRSTLSALDDTDAWKCHVEVFARAVEITLETKMVYGPSDINAIKKALNEGERRLRALASGRRQDVFGRDLGKSPLIVGGFRSKIDGSVQPFGVELPPNWGFYNGELRLDVWLHGRGERVSEAKFLQQRSTSPGQYQPKKPLVLHPYGRYSNAFKFAGEIDVLEAIDCVKQLWPVDETRIAVRGFSMGGAGCWQMAVHYPNLWAAANPGAGFSETREFLRVFQDEDFQPTWFQSKLLHWYDCPDWTNNLRNVPTVAYSGEVDRQKQAADVMEAAFASRNMKLPHIIGPKTGHKIHPGSKVEIQKWLDEELADGKPELPKEIDLTTYSLRYNELGWLRVTGLEQHWEESRIRGALKEDEIVLKTQGVTSFALVLPAGVFSGDAFKLRIDDQEIMASVSGNLSFQKSEDGWAAKAPATGLRKKPGLQGPVDDAFMDAFTFVGPSVEDDSVVGRWAATEFDRAKYEWRRQFRGDVVEDTLGTLTEKEIADRNLILFGTPKSNPLIAKVLPGLPIKWTPDTVQFGGTKHEGNVAPILIYPNPLNPERYVVINSGFTYREYAYLNNARQIPMLPDWAIVDVTEGGTTQYPGKVLSAGFFDEQWNVSDQR